MRSIWGFRAGFCVILLYILVAGVLACGFGSYLTRTEMVSIARDGGVNIDTLINLIKRKEQLEGEIELTRAKIQEIDQIIIDRKKELDKVRDDLRNLEDAQRRPVVLLRRQIVARAKQLDPALYPDLPDLLQETDDLALVTRFYHEYDAFYPAPGLSETESAALVAELTQGREKVLNFEEQLKTLTAREIDLESDHDRAQEMRSWPRKRMEEQTTEFVKINAKLDENATQMAQLVSLFRVFKGGLLAEMVTYPMIFLTLIVTVAAGALGSLVKYSRRLESDLRTDRPVTDLLVNLGEGVAAALAIFLFSGAGLLMLSQGAGENRMVELSPYMVAFLAFISGFMAEDAFRRIQHAGNQIFRIPDESAPKADTPAPAPPATPPEDKKHPK